MREMSSDVTMPHSPSVVLAVVPILAFAAMGVMMGCATTMGSHRTVVAVDAPPTHTSSEVVVNDTLVPPVAAEQAPSRRRLSQTVTLGQGTSEPIYAAPASQQGPSTSGNVTVNNNITVVNQQPAVYGGYGGYGYGYGYGYGTGVGYGGAGARDVRSSTGNTRSAWAPTGWEGAQRTAAPGRTPGVGGNFAPAPSFGPKEMR